MKHWPRLLPAAVFLGGFLLYVSTLAPSVVFGDPAEYTFVPYIWGVIHPPGYAFQTLLARLWQTLIPIGTIAYRTNLLSATAAALTVALVYTSVLRVAYRVLRFNPPNLPPLGRPISNLLLPALLAASTLAVSPDFWQHALHANAHIVTATLAALSLYCVVRWYTEGNNRWLYTFALVAGLSVTHHPLLAFSFPAYAAFILSARPDILRVAYRVLPVKWPNLQSRDTGREQSPISNLQSPNWLLLIGLALLGLAPWLYFPIRAGLEPPPVIGPHDMNTFEGFLNLALARGLTVNLFHFSFGQQWQRAIVFWSLLRLQLPLPLIALIPMGLVYLWRREWRVALLFTVFLAVNLAFIFNTVQDVMAYFLVPLVGLAMMVGVGGIGLANWLKDKFSNPQSPISNLLNLILLILPLATMMHLYPRISLREYRAADEYVDGLFERFEGRGEGAILLSDWEHLTPLWYRQYVEGQAFAPADLTPVFVSGGERPWVDSVWRNIEAGPIYVIEYQPQIVAEGFRLRADGELYLIVPPPAVDSPSIANPLSLLAGGQIEVLGYDLAQTTAQAGDVIPLTLYLRVPQTISDIIFPYATLGPYGQHWTTDSHLLTPAWQPGEIIAERFDLTVPLDAPAGELPLMLGIANLTTGEELALETATTEQQLVELATIQVEANPSAPPARVLDGLLANFGQRVGVEQVTAWAGGRVYEAPWPEPVPLRPGQALHLLVTWRALALPEASATVFLHLLDGGNGLWAGQDYTPLGGAFPTMLWFPKWLEGQRVLDPYTLTVPPDAPPGDYYIELGLYGLRSIQRLPAFDRAGSLAGDRLVLGWVRVGE